MAIPHLTAEEVRTWTREQKDQWWLSKVFRGNMPQLTLRAGLTGFVLGGVLSATNLYVGAKTGWTLGVGVTSVILAFAIFRVMSRLGVKDMTILENNCSQSVATAAGYMTGPLLSGMAAYMWVQNALMPWWQMMLFNVVLSVLGVLVAFPMKRRFINDEHQPFPEGRAVGVVLDTVYTADAAIGLFKAKALAVAGGLAAVVTFLAGANYMRLIQRDIFGRALDKVWSLPLSFEWFYDWLGSNEPKLAGVPFRQYGLTPGIDLAMIGAGGLMGIRTASSMLAGMVINFMIIAPWMISIGEIPPKSGTLAGGDAVFGRPWIVNKWSLWWGVVIMVVASLVSMFSKPKVFAEAFRTLTSRAKKPVGADVLRHIELPLWISWVGMPIVGAMGVWMAWAWFDVPILFGALAIPLILFLTLIAASSTALTSITPTGAVSKIPQFIFGAANPTHAPTNLMTAVMCTEVASNASNLLMDIKPGYMLGAKPRQQAIGHCIGIVAGALASTPLLYLLFLSNYDASAHHQAIEAGNAAYIQQTMMPEGSQFAFPGAIQWKGVSDLVRSVFDPNSSEKLLTHSILISMIVAGVVGLILEVARIFTRNKFPISPLAIGLGVVIQPESTMCMFAGALFFWIMHKIYDARKSSVGHKLWVATHEPICAGVVAGAALMGIGDQLLKALVYSG